MAWRGVATLTEPHSSCSRHAPAQVLGHGGCSARRAVVGRRARLLRGLSAMHPASRARQRCLFRGLRADDEPAALTLAAAPTPDTRHPSARLLPTSALRIRKGERGATRLEVVAIYAGPRLRRDGTRHLSPHLSSCRGAGPSQRCTAGPCRRRAAACWPFTSYGRWMPLPHSPVSPEPAVQANLRPATVQCDSAECEPAILRQAREFLVFPLLPREASK